MLGRTRIHLPLLVVGTVHIETIIHNCSYGSSRQDSHHYSRCLHPYYTSTLSLLGHGLVALVLLVPFFSAVPALNTLLVDRLVCQTFLGALRSRLAEVIVRSIPMASAVPTFVILWLVHLTEGRTLVNQVAFLLTQFDNKPQVPSQPLQTPSG